MIAMPQMLFDFAGMVRINYPEIWQCLGMVIEVYGMGSGSRHRIIGGIGRLCWWVTILTNDLVWWVPFGMMLWDAQRDTTTKG